jgi:hypothetical protein
MVSHNDRGCDRFTYVCKWRELEDNIDGSKSIKKLVIE